MPARPVSRSWIIPQPRQSRDVQNPSEGLRNRRHCRARPGARIPAASPRAACSAPRDGGSQTARRASAPPPTGTGPIVRSSLCRGERVVRDREHLMTAIAIVCSTRSRAELSRETRARTRIEAGARRGGALGRLTKVADQIPVWGDKRSCRDKARSVMESGATLVHYFCGSA